MQKKLLRRTSLQKRAIEQQINDALAQTIEAVNEHLQDLEKSIDAKLAEAKVHFEGQKCQIDAIINTARMELQRSSNFISESIEKSDSTARSIEGNIHSAIKGIEDIREIKRTQLKEEIDRIKRESSFLRDRLLISISPKPKKVYRK
ncbi:hypothetical protein MDAP_001233 [Mitosporidium daphniae]